MRFSGLTPDSKAPAHSRSIPVYPVGLAGHFMPHFDPEDAATIF